MRFADTNVLLYAVSRDPQERHKAERARGILAERDLALSVQVLQEFYVQATREGRSDPLTHEQAAKLVESFLRFPLADVTRQVVLAAIAAQASFPHLLLGRRDPRSGPLHRLRHRPLGGPERRPGLRRSAGAEPISLTPATA